MKERRLELKIGVLVVAAIAGVALLLVLTGELRFGARSHFAVDLSHSGALVKGAPVKLAGVTVGRVGDVKLLPNRRTDSGEPLPVRVELSLDQSAFASLTTAVDAAIATQGPLGEPYVELTPSSRDAPPLKEGQAIRGRDPVRLDRLLARAAAMLEAFDRGQDPTELFEALSNIGRLAARLDALLAAEQEDLSGLIAELSATVRDVRAVAGRMRETLGPEGEATRLLENGAALSALLRQRAPQMSEDAARALAGIAHLTADLDAEDGVRVKESLARVAAATASLERLATRGERVLARIEAGEGTLGALQQDATLYEELRALVTDLRKHPWKVLWKD